MLPGTVNHLLQAFQNLSSSQVVHIDTLIRDHPYPVVAGRVTTRFGPTVQLKLRTNSDINVKIYLPKQYAEVIDDDDMNLGMKSYKLIYVGFSGLVFVLNMTL